MPAPTADKNAGHAGVFASRAVLWQATRTLQRSAHPALCHPAITSGVPGIVARVRMATDRRPGRVARIVHRPGGQRYAFPGNMVCPPRSYLPATPDMPPCPPAFASASTLLSRTCIRAAAILLLTGLIIPPAPAVAAPAKPPLRLGDITSAQRDPAFALRYRQGWTLAVEEINASGGLLGRRVEVLTRDDAGDPAKAVAQARDLVQRLQVAALFGGHTSESALALSGYADSARVPYLAVAPLSRKLTWQQGNAHTFRLRPGAWSQAAAVAPKALGRRKLKWALVYQDDESGRELASAFKALMLAFQSKSQFVYDTPLGPATLRAGTAAATVKSIEAARPEALFIALTGKDLAAFVRAGQAADLFDGRPVVSLFTGYPENLTALREANLRLPADWIITGYPRDAITSLAHQDFVAAYTARFAVPPTMASLLGYTALKSLGAAIRQAGSADSAGITTALTGLKLDTPVGEIEFRRMDHQATLGVFLGYSAAGDSPAMDRFVLVPGTRLQPPDEQVRRLRSERGTAAEAQAAPRPEAAKVSP